MGKLLYISAASPLWTAIYMVIIKGLVGSDISGKTAELLAKIGVGILGGGLFVYLGLLIFTGWTRREGLVSGLILLVSLLIFMLLVG